MSEPSLAGPAQRGRRFPDWFKKNLSCGRRAAATESILQDLHLNTICHSGRCPNRDECFAGGAAAFLILGNVCTRGCTFCAVQKGSPDAVDPGEPVRISDAVARLGIRHAVITSVTRDDLEDEGSGQFVSVIKQLRRDCPGVTVEVLTPDFSATQNEAVARIGAVAPEVFNHNVETVPRLYPRVRRGADYTLSLRLLKMISDGFDSILTKSGLMLGLGETDNEVLRVMKDLLDVGCRSLTVGQYLPPRPDAIALERFVEPETFDRLRREALAMGFWSCESGPYVRSSFHAPVSYQSAKNVSQKD